MFLCNITNKLFNNLFFRLKDFDMYVLAGEIGFGKGMWNESGWKYNFIFKQWKQLKKYIKLFCYFIII